MLIRTGTRRKLNFGLMLAVGLLVLAVLPGIAEAQKVIAELGVGAQQGTSVRTLDSTWVDTMHWRSIGPGSMGGRVIRLAVVDSNPDIYWVGVASGGLWKTTDGGKTFTGQFQYEEINSIGDVAASQSNPEIVWVGTGEHNPRNSTIYGKGVYKSYNGGETWTCMGLQETRHIGRIAIHPTNPDIVYVGAMGRTWGPNEERGLYKTTDGGQTWEKILYVNDQTGVIEMQMNPKDPDTLLVATWQRQRDIYDSGEPALSHGPGSGIWKTTDGGETFKRLGPETGLPKSDMGRTGIDYFRSDPDIVYLITGGSRAPQEENGIYKSIDGGENWTKVNDSAPRPMYYSQIRVDPSNPDNVIVLGTRMTRSIDGCVTLERAGQGVHVDHHALWIDPRDGNHVLVGNDGGLGESFDGGLNFTPIKKFAIGQFYDVEVDTRRLYYVGGGLQDNGTWYGPSMTRGKYGPRNEDFRSIGGGDGFVVQIDPTDPTIIYTESQGGSLRRRGGPQDARLQRPREGPEGERLSGAWKTDFVLSPHNPKIYFTAFNYVLKSSNYGADMIVISPKITLTNGGHGTAITVSPLNPDVIYAGTDDGGLWITRDGGFNWSAVHDNIDIPLDCYVSTLEASRYAEGRCYVAFDGHRSDDERPFIYITEDLGATWTCINANLPEFGSTRCLREDTKNPNVLYCGTEFFGYASVDRGNSWTKMNNNLPTTAIHDFDISDAAGELVAGTHGRSIWDDSFTCPAGPAPEWIVQ
ncbi:WD40/YVTN/BNR-like repeat-containing protein, partial [Planctomycetota bacterium]